MGEPAKPLPAPGGPQGGADGSKTRRSVTGSLLPQDWNNTSFIVKRNVFGLGGCYGKQVDENMSAWRGNSVSFDSEVKSSAA